MERKLFQVEWLLSDSEISFEIWSNKRNNNNKTKVKTNAVKQRIKSHTREQNLFAMIYIKNVFDFFWYTFQ